MHIQKSAMEGKGCAPARKEVNDLLIGNDIIQHNTKGTMSQSCFVHRENGQHHISPKVYGKIWLFRSEIVNVQVLYCN